MDGRRPGVVVVLVLGGVLLIGFGRVGVRLRRGEPEAAGSAWLEDAAVPDGIDAGPEAASLAVDRLQLFRTGNAGAEMTLDGAEVTALLRHAVPGVVPPGVSDPSVRFEDGHVSLIANLAPSILPGGRYLTDARQHLPESVPVEVSGTLSNESGSPLGYEVERVLVAGLPVPRAVVELVVQAVQQSTSIDVSATARPAAEDALPTLRVLWPRDGGEVSIEGDHLLLSRAEPMPLQTVDGSGGAGA